jgi:hypothetical protein
VTRDEWLASAGVHLDAAGQQIPTNSTAALWSLTLAIGDILRGLQAE